MPEQQQIQLNADPKVAAGAYANAMRVMHTREEFVMEFLNLHPPVGELSAKVITTPGHMKRLLLALGENVKRYESQFGEIREASAPAAGEIGFKG